MRTLKFRVYDKKENVWIHGPGKEVNLFGETIILGAFLEGVKLERLNDLVALQFTGLLDKNGVEVYEGDVIENGNGPVYVFWNKAYLAWWVGYDSEAPEQQFYTSLINFSDENEIEVIGNIHEHGDLIK